MPTQLAVLCADLDIQQVMRTLLGERARALAIAPPPEVKFLRHPHKDPGCFVRPEAVLGNRSIAERALVVFDRAFDGAPNIDAASLDDQVEGRLRPIWGDRARAVAIEPEVEVWLWTGRHTADALGWKQGYADLRSWLERQGLWTAGSNKPRDPKEALKRVLRKTSPGPPRGIFEHVAQRASLEACTDASFARLRGILREWFPARP